MPVKRSCIVDGYNVIFARWVRPPTSEEELAQGRRLLLDYAARFAQQRRMRTTVIFDGVRPPGEVAGGRTRDVRVLWSGPKRSADQLIVGLVDRAGGGATVVSGDRSGVVDEVERRGAVVLSPAEFICAIQRPGKVGRTDDKPSHVSPEDVEYWLGQFGRSQT